MEAIKLCRLDKNDWRIQPAEFLLRHGSDKTLQVGYANHFYRSAHKFEQICRHRLRRQNVGYSNFSQPQSHLSFCVLLQYLVERDRKSGSAGMPRPISYAVFCLKKKKKSNNRKYRNTITQYSHQQGYNS